MKWTFEEFKPSLEDLKPEVRKKALEIANDLMEKRNYTEEEAIKEAIKKAEEWYLNIQG